MTGSTRQTPAILYEHALLGEGIARYLRVETGMEATLAPADDLEAVKAALAGHPGVVIFERSGCLCGLDLTRLAPGAVFFDVSNAVRRGTAPVTGMSGFDQIVQAVRGTQCERTADADPAARGR